MSFLSKIGGAAKGIAKGATKGATGVVRTAAKVSLAPTTIATAVAAKVAPKPLASLIRKAGNLTPQAIVARKVLSMSSAKAAPAAAAAIARTPPAQTRAALAVARVMPAAIPAINGGRGTPVVRVAPMQAPPPPPPPMDAAPAAAAPDDAGGGPDPGYDYSGGGEGGDVDPYGQNSGEPTAPPPDGASDDPTVELPDGYLAPQDDGGNATLGDIDYHAALGDIGDWKSDLANFGKQAALTVGKQALTTIGGKLTTAGAPIPPPPPPGMSPVVKVAIGAGALVGVYLLLSRRHAAPAAPAASS